MEGGFTTIHTGPRTDPSVSQLERVRTKEHFYRELVLGSCVTNVAFHCGIGEMWLVWREARGWDDV
jgi:hypothetical protein